MAQSRLTVAGILEVLNEAFPFEKAAAWDNVGLLVGNPQTEVTGVVFALDVTAGVLAEAQEAGFNVVVTHHPVFLEPLKDLDSSRIPATDLVLQAVQAGIALIACHTNLDVAEEARTLLGKRLGLIDKGALPGRSSLRVPHQPDSLYAELFESPTTCSLLQLARTCHATFKTPPTVYGSRNHPITRVVTATGSGSELLDGARAVRADAIITGEMKYHAALDALSCGVTVIELGHDVSEWPLVGLLADVVGTKTFLGPSRMRQVKPRTAWWIVNGD